MAESPTDLLRGGSAPRPWGSIGGGHSSRQERTISRVVVAFVAALAPILLFQVNPELANDTSVSNQATLPETLAAEIQLTEYTFHGGPDSWTAYNRTNDFTSSIDASGAHITCSPIGGPTEGHTIDIHLSASGRESYVAPPSLPVVSADGEVVTLDRGSVLERWTNTPDGLKHSFEIADADRSGSGAVELDVSIEGGFTVHLEHPATAIIRTQTGATLLHYMGLVVYDVAGNPLPARVELQGGSLRLLIDDSAATYPIYVDPLATSPNRTLESDQTGARLSFSVASGDLNGDGYSDVAVGA